MAGEGGEGFSAKLQQYDDVEKEQRVAKADVWRTHMANDLAQREEAKRRLKDVELEREREEGERPLAGSVSTHRHIYIYTSSRIPMGDL